MAAIKKIKPTTPGQRFRVANTFEEITTDKHIYNIAKSKEGLINSFLKMLGL